MDRRTYRQDTKKQGFIEVIPTSLTKTRLGTPGKRKSLPLIKHPWEIDPFVDLLGKIPDLCIVVILGCKKNPRKKKRRVDR